MSGTTDKIKGAANQAAGSVKKSVGNVLGDDKMAAEGAAQQVKGQVQEAIGKGKIAIKKVVDNA